MTATVLVQYVIVMRILILGSLAACASHAEWALPPAEAVAECVYRRVGADEDRATSTLHFDARGRVIQVDGFHHRSLAHVSWTLEYDERDRLVRRRSSEHDVHFTYHPADAPTEVLESSDDETFRWELDEQGRVRRFHGPLAFSDELQSSFEYAYNAAGQIVHYKQGIRISGKEGEPTKVGRQDVSYGYDARGRLIGFGGGNTLQYTETDNRQIIEEVSPIGTSRRWIVERDSQQRLLAVNVEQTGEIIEYSHADGVLNESARFENRTRLLTATGACPTPDVDLVPRPVAITWSATPAHAIAPVTMRPALPQFLFERLREPTR